MNLATDTEDSLLCSDNRQETDKFLRLALSFLSQHDINPNPVNVTLGFDYVSGRNLDLKIALDNALARGPLEQSLANDLYRRYIWDDDKERFEKFRSELRKRVSETLSGVHHASIQVEHSADSLASSAARLERSVTTEEAHKIIDVVVNETRTLLYNNLLLHKMLDETRREVEHLGVELERTRQQVSIDALTGLKNRRAFEAELDEACAHANGHPTALLLIDIDNLEDVNETYGHLVGDRVIRHVGALLSENIKGKDTAARMGVEGFAVALNDTPLAAAERVAESLRATIEKRRLTRADTGEMVSRVTVSIGATALRKSETRETFFARADQALSEAKHNGRNRIAVIRTH